MAFFQVKSQLPTLYESYDFISPAHFAEKLEGKVVLITGASAGLGKETCLSFAAAGASVACVARRRDRLEALVSDIKERHNVPAMAVEADVSEPGTPKRVIAEVERELGPIDILLNNAGIQRVGALADEDDMTAYWRVMEVNVRAPMELVHAVLPSMMARKTGIIINVGSRATTLDIPLITVYGMSKAALTKFTQDVAAQVAEHGILCYSIHPGAVMTELASVEGAMNPKSTEQPAFQDMLKIFMSQKFQTPEIMAHATVALCADPRWKVMNGKYIDMEQPLDEVLKEAEKSGMGRIGDEDLYRLKIDIL